MPRGTEVPGARTAVPAVPHEAPEDAAAAVREIVAPGHDLALARMGWIVGDLGASIAAQAWGWAEQAEKVFTKCRDTLLRGAESNLKPFVRELEATLEGFSVKSKEKAAEAVSKATGKLEQLINLADATFTDMGLPADVLEPSKRLAHAARVSTAGVSTRSPPPQRSTTSCRGSPRATPSGSSCRATRPSSRRTSRRS